MQDPTNILLTLLFILHPSIVIIMGGGLRQQGPRHRRIQK
jgi:hypothetical protein